MLKVHVLGHKDGDHLAIVRVPWWYDIYEWLVNRLCPCCGVTGFLIRKSDWVEGQLYGRWSSLLTWSMKFEKELYRVPIESNCIASYAIWGNYMCWHDEECIPEKAKWAE
jgi:hypothetical protein